MIPREFLGLKRSLPYGWLGIVVVPEPTTLRLTAGSRLLEYM